MSVLALLLALAVFAAVGAVARAYLLPTTGRHAATYLATHTVTAVQPRRIDIGKWI